MQLDISRFDWEKYKGTELEDQAIEALNFCRRALACGTFPRENYQELVQLILVWLGGVGEVPRFKFQWPRAYHHACFMGKNLFILRIELLGSNF